MAEVQHNSRPGGKKKRGGLIHLDTTPMVDLAFLLLTFFMLATSFLGKDKCLEILMPDKCTECPLANCNGTLSLIAGSNGHFYYYSCKPNELHETSLSPDGLRKMLMDLNHRYKNFQVMLKPMDKASYGNVVAIIDELNITNTRYMLVDVKPGEKKLIAAL